MKSQQSAVSSQQSEAKIQKKLFLTIIFLLFTIHYSLSPSYADEIKSKAALVMDASTDRILFAKNPNLKLPPASTTKLITAMVVLDKAQLNDKVIISEKAAKVPSLRGTRFKAGETFTVETLLYAALLRSANDAAFALAEAVAGSEEKFVELMNKKIIAIGASDTKFINTTGLPGSGQHITVFDLAKVMKYSLKYPVIREIINTRATEISTEEGRTIPLENTNKLLWYEDGVVGGKTGYTRAARHCFTYACERNGQTVVAALLGAPSRKTLWEEAERLVQKGFDVMEKDEQPTIYFTKADYTAPKGIVRKKSSRTKRYYRNIKAKFDLPSKKKFSIKAEEKRNGSSEEQYTKKDQRSKRAEVERLQSIYS